MSEQEVVDVIKQVEAAELDGNAEALDALLAADFGAIGPRAFILNKAQWLERYTSGALKNTKFELQDLAVRVYGDSAVATVVQDQESTHGGHDASGKFRSTVVVARQDGKWQVVHYHISGPVVPMGPPPQS